MIVAEINNGLGSTVSAHFWWLQNNQQQFKMIVMIKIHGHKLIPNTSIHALKYMQRNKVHKINWTRDKIMFKGKKREIKREW